MAPDFAVTLAGGATRRLTTYRGHPVILFFFPKADTAGCTAETRGFSERYLGFQSAGFEVIGLSVDSAKTQAEFGEKCGASFPLVGDPSKGVARQYGVLGLLGMAKRVTFLLNAEGRVEDRVEGILPARHLRAAERWVAGHRAPGQASRGPTPDG